MDNSHVFAILDMIGNHINLDGITVPHNGYRKGTKQWRQTTVDMDFGFWVVTEYQLFKFIELNFDELTLAIYYHDGRDIIRARAMAELHIKSFNLDDPIIFDTILNWIQPTDIIQQILDTCPMFSWRPDRKQLPRDEAYIEWGPLEINLKP